MGLARGHGQHRRRTECHADSGALTCFQSTASAVQSLLGTTAGQLSRLVTSLAGVLSTLHGNEIELVALANAVAEVRRVPVQEYERYGVLFG